MMPKKYKQIPIEIEAMQLTESNALDIMNWVNADTTERNGKAICVAPLNNFTKTRDIQLDIFPRGTTFARLGDYVVKGADNNYYVCPRDAFEKHYKEVE